MNIVDQVDTVATMVECKSGFLSSFNRVKFYSPESAGSE